MSRWLGDRSHKEPLEPAAPMDPAALLAARTRVTILYGAGQHDTASVLRGVLAEVDRLTDALASARRRCQTVYEEDVSNGRMYADVDLNEAQTLLATEQERSQRVEALAAAWLAYNPDDQWAQRLTSALAGDAKGSS